MGERAGAATAANAAAARGERDRGARWTLAAVGVVFFLSLLGFPHGTPTAGLDNSWQQILSWSATRDVVYGRDLVFTYGPLGFLASRVYAPELYGVRVGWEILVALALAALFLWHFARVPSRLEQILFVYVLCALVAASPSAVDLAAMLALALWALARGAPAQVALAVAALVHFGLVKFSLLVLAALLAAGLALTLAAGRRFAAGAAAALALPVSVVALWLVAGQPLPALLVWLAHSAEVARGYAVAMAFPDRIGDLWLSLALIAWAGVFVALAWCRPRLDTERLLRTTLVVGWMLVAWRAGFVRQDEGHMVMFHAPVLMVPLLVRGATPPRLRLATWAFALAALVVASSVGSPEFGDVKRYVRGRPVRDWAERLAVNAGMLVRLGGRAELEERLAASRAEHALPLVRETVGDGRVDLFGHSQGWVFLNGLRFALRPTIQTYNAYTPALQRLDAEWYAGPDAPVWSLVDLTAIDERWPASEDALGLEALRARYEPVLSEGELLLLRRREDGAPPPAAEALVAREARWGERVPLPRAGDGGALRLALDIRLSLPGRVRSALWRAPVVHLEVELRDGWERFRVVPMREAPAFVIAPALRNTADLVDWARGAPPPWPRAIRLVAEDGTAYAFAPRYGLALERTAPHAFAGGPVPGLSPIPHEDDAH